jgi:hypothetical protein
MGNGRLIPLHHTDDQWQIYAKDPDFWILICPSFMRLFLPTWDSSWKPPTKPRGRLNEYHPEDHFRRKASQAVREITSCDYKHMSGRLLRVLVLRTELVPLPESDFLLAENYVWCRLQGWVEEQNTWIKIRMWTSKRSLLQPQGRDGGWPGEGGINRCL